MWNELLIALALILIIEGIMPFMNPAGLRKMMLMATQMDDKTLRTIGLISMVSGLLLLYLVL
jgi:uncharacterized protein